MNTLFPEFPAVSDQQWEALVRADLKGGDYDKKLVWQTNEGIAVQPYYRTAPATPDYVRGRRDAGNTWKIRQDIEVTDIKTANRKALDALMQGVTSLGFVFGQQSVISQDDFSRLLSGIHIEAIELHFVSVHDSADMITMLANEGVRRELRYNQIQGSVNIEPLNFLTITGNYPDYDNQQPFLRAKQLVDFAHIAIPGMRVIGIGGDTFHLSGGTAVHELAFSLSQANDYLAAFSDMGIPVDDAAPHFQLNLSVGSSYFIEIAKFRAARWLWAKMIEAYRPLNESSKHIYIQAHTSAWNMTAYDSYTNMLRNTTEAMSAIIGGADSLTVLPFDFPLGKTSELGERSARNTQNVLREEAYLDKVTDAAAGSYYIEQLTAQLAQQAWNLFLETERYGSYVRALQNGFVQQHISQAAQRRDMNIATRREILLGTNQYPNFDEQILSKIHPLQQLYAPADKTIVTPLKPYRAAEAFEQLRLHTERSGKRPRVFMLTLGNLAMRRARATFACNFVACAGFEVIDNIGFDSVEQGIQQALQQQSNMVVVCSSDDEYPSVVPQIMSQLQGKNVLVVLAGYPTEHIESFKTLGLQHYIHVRSNVLQSLQQFQQLLLG